MVVRLLRATKNVKRISRFYFERLIVTHCESREHCVHASRSLLFWVMELKLLRMTGEIVRR